jgi:arylsulfatase A-like enzyme
VDDIFPSILQLTNIKPKGKIQHVDGLSLVPIIQRKNSNQNRYFTWHHPHMRTNGSPDVQPFSAIRQGDWKLIFFHKDQHFELYNTRTDLSEKNNLFNLIPEKGEFLAKKLGDKLRSTESKMLIDKEKQKEIIYPF